MTDRITSLTLSDVKAHCRVSFDDDDDLLQSPSR